MMRVGKDLRTKCVERKRATAVSECRDECEWMNEIIHWHQPTSYIKSTMLLRYTTPAVMATRITSPHDQEESETIPFRGTPLQRRMAPFPEVLPSSQVPSTGAPSYHSRGYCSAYSFVGTWRPPWPRAH